MHELGRLERVELREVWESESAHFTPWLAQEANIKVLADAIGLDLEVEAQEKNVGPFRADILCKDTATGAWVLIENQLERTDHTHLGQLMTYAAGLDAVTIVWVSSQFTEEHRAALDWLNRITDEKFNFFGLEIELWRIGSSAVAPKFNLVSQPNNWGKRVTEGAHTAGELTEKRQLQLEYWTAFRAFLAERSPGLRTTSPRPQHWLGVSLGRSGVSLAAVASRWDSVRQTYATNELRVELVLDGSDAKAFYQTLEVQKVDIEAALGESLTWCAAENTRTCRVFVQTTVNLDDRSDWLRQHGWLRDKLEAMKRVFSPIVKDLRVVPAEDGL